MSAHDPPCRVVYGEIWFETSPDYDEALAVRICCSCPLLTPCLKLAMRAEVTTRIGKPAAEADRFGIFGGLTPHQRAYLSERDARNRPTRAIA